ncbi:RING-type E3 ubiquitin transferase [Salvia divinorum]|uniref:RING-type E3 ubiquitin transferase n=1 Tax=Salvia divinorum TaxID=28513 RepID=A0ABD1HHM0_SALDI
MDATETETETRALPSQEVIWWRPWNMEEATLVLPAGVTLPVAIYYNYVPMYPSATPPRSHHPSQDDVLSGFKTRRCDDDADQHDEEEACCICLDDLHRGSVTTLDCRHEFHSDCIRRWLVRGKNFCPLCKAPAIK